MCRHLIIASITVAHRVAVVDDGLGVVYEVAGGLPFQLRIIVGGVREVLSCHGICVQGCQRGMWMFII